MRLPGDAMDPGVRPYALASGWLAALALVLASTLATAHAQAPAPVVEQPRPFGHVVGDVLSQRVLLELQGRPFAPAAVPGAERLGVWLERRPSRIETGADGRRWLVVEYQLINAPQALTVVSLPAWELRPEGAEVLHIAEWPLSVAPLTPRTAFAKGDLVELRPDRGAPVIETQPMRRAARGWSLAFALTLAAWLAWLLWRNAQASARQPFARALHELRGLDEHAPVAWQAVHRAFDRTAGRATQTATLPELFRRAPHLEPLRPDIEQFYAQSARLFFGNGLPPQPMPLRPLCAALRRLEKQHER